MKNTDLDKIKSEAILFLNLVPEADKNIEFIVHHPFINTPYLISAGSDKMFNIFENEKQFKQWKESYKQYIQQLKSAISIMNNIQNAYKLVFFKYIDKWLSDEDFGECLINVYINTEFISDNKDVRISTLIKWFKQCNKSSIMNEAEINVYNSLSDEIIVYRGVSSEKYKLGISWTLDKDVAAWFSKRFDKSSFIYSCKVKKSDILCYINSRNEKEVIIDIKALKNIDTI